MRFQTVFNLSTYLTFAVATLCLGVAEEAFTPWAPFLGVAAVLVIGVAYLLEGRWSLSLPAANAVGFFLAIGAAAWMLYNLLRPSQELIEVAPWVRGLPPLGVVLMGLLPAKLFRPKLIRDYWGLHSIALMEVALAGVLTADMAFAVFLVLYLLCALWAVSLFYLYREQAAARETGTASATKGLAPSAGFLGLRTPARLAGVVVGTGLFVFLVTPQHGDIRWDPFVFSRNLPGSQALTGFSGGVDLNRTGAIALDESVAFEAEVEDADHQPKTDLPADQRWRGATYDVYDDGRWDHPTLAANGLGQIRPALVADAPFPNFGPRQFTVTVTVDTRLSPGLFLAEPVMQDTQGNRSPVRLLLDNKVQNEPLQQGGPLTGLPVSVRGILRYQQVTAPLPEPDVGQQIVRRFGTASAAERRPLRPRDLQQTFWFHQPVERIDRWVNDTLLPRLVTQGKLAKEDLTRSNVIDESRPVPVGAPKGSVTRRRGLQSAHWEKVARAMADYLATSGEYRYSLDRQRSDYGIDPTADFLFNVKQGHCDRYATAMVLMLRSCGIPSRLATGFRGAENQGNGKYIVRQSFAHTWAEAIIARPGVRKGEPDLYWLALDPTPLVEVQAAQDFSWSRWWQDQQFNLRYFWRNFILDYNTQHQRGIAAAIGSLLAGPAEFTGLRDEIITARILTRPWLWILALSPMVWWTVRKIRWRRARQRAAAVKPAAVPGTGFYARLLAVLARSFGLAPRPSDTPREFGEAAGEALREHDATAAWADTPARAAVLFYRVRYGDRPLTEPEARAIDRQVDALSAALSAPTPGNGKV